MPAVTFSRAFDYRVPGRVAVVSYRAGWSGKVPVAHAAAAGKAGALVKPVTKRKDEDDGACLRDG